MQGTTFLRGGSLATRPGLRMGGGGAGGARSAAAAGTTHVRMMGASSSSRARAVACRAVFEKFSERSIKAVMISQQQAKELGASEVRFFCVCLLLLCA
jgi:hypothetical protein